MHASHSEDSILIVDREIGIKNELPTQVSILATLVSCELRGPVDSGVASKIHEDVHVPQTPVEASIRPKESLHVCSESIVNS